MSDLLDRIEAYLDEVPRAAATVEDHGSMRLFTGTGAWPYYARPRPGHGPVVLADVETVLARQRRRGSPQKVEWLEETAPSAAEAVAAAGLQIERHPLLVLGERVAAEPVDGVHVRLLHPDDHELPAAQAAIEVGFSTPGTAVGTASVRAREHAQAGRDPRVDTFIRHQLRAGHSIMVVAEDDDGPVAGGMANPRGPVAELVGIATLPAARRRGIGALVTARLVDALAADGVRTIFLGAADEHVARVYRRVGFREIATACEAAPSR